MGKENGFVPIDEANTERIRFDVDLPPFVERTNVRANPERLEGWMRLGGISHLRVETFEGERVMESPAILGFDAQGNAYAGKSGTAVGDSNAIETNKHRRGYPYRDIRLKINVNELDRKIRDMNVRSSVPWANEINNSVSRAIRETGSKVLIEDQLRAEVFGTATYTYFLSQILLSQDESSALVLGSGLLMRSAMIIVLPDINGRHSFFVGPQLDRAALLQARTRLHKVVKGFEEKK